jgi:hypothetical protein
LLQDTEISSNGKIGLRYRVEESWAGAAELLKNAVTAEQFAHSLDAALVPFGARKARKIAASSYRSSLPGAPDGEYVVIQFDASFEKKRVAVETVTPMLEADGIWRVSGYYIT